VVTADENESVVEAAQRMAQLAVGDLIVVKDRPQGQPHSRAWLHAVEDRRTFEL